MNPRHSGVTGSYDAQALARALDPTGPVLRDEVSAVGHAAGALRHDRVRAWLQTISAALLRPGVTVVFGGHFSSGKSTVINALLGRDLLPVSDYPETGVACWIRGGQRDEVTAITDQGKLTLAVSQAAIAHEVSLVDGDGEYRRRPQKVRRVAVTMAGGTPPAGVTWIDSPGINDTDSMTERARDAAGNADLLVWVVNSRQALSLVEQRFLTEYAALRGNAGVLCVVNVFLPLDTAQHWQRYRDTRFGPVTERIRQATGDWAGEDQLEVVFASARGAGAEPDGFGGPQLRELLSSVASVDHPRVAAARLQRAAIDLGGLIEQVDGWIDAEQANAVSQRQALEVRRGELERQRRGLARALRQEVRSVFARHQSTAQECVNVVWQRIDTDLRRDSTYADLLRDRLTAVADQLAADLVRVAADAARAHQHSGPGDDVRKRIQTLLRPGTISIFVPDTQVRKGKGVGGAAIGAAIGTLMLPGLGTVIGGALGGLTGSGISASQAIDADKAAARTNATHACTQAVQSMMAQETAVATLLTEASRPLVALHTTPDTRALDSLRRLRARLTEQRAVAEAAAAALRRATALRQAGG